jgi:hypothetical protein
MIQGFSGGLLNRELIYQTDLPSFQRDFASLKTLDHGTGPAITFTRASGATYFDADGVLQAASNNVPRFDHSATGSSLGLLIEEARTNSIRNSQGGGSTNGVIGSGGVMPTHWASVAFGFGNVEVIGSGTEAGLSYVDVRFYGTNSSGNTGIMGYYPEFIAASHNQTWTGSHYVKLQAGSTSGVDSFSTNIFGRKVDQTGTGDTTTVTFTPSSSFQRVSATCALSSADTALVSTDITIYVLNGQSIDITLRIAAPQLEQGAFATSYIPTTSAAATRAADSAVVTPISSFYNASEGTLFAEATPKTESLNNGVQRVLLTANDNTDLNQITIGQGGSGNLDKLVFVSFINAGGGTAEMFGGSGIAGSTQKAAGAYKASDFAFSVNGGAVDTEASGSPASGITHLFIGRRPADGVVSGHIRKIAYFPKRLSNALLQSLTT